MSEKVKLSRYRNTDYFVKYDGNGNERKFTWKGSVNGRIDTKEVPREVADWLSMNTICFDKGELVIEDKDDKESVKEIKDGIIEKEAYDNNTHTQDEIVKILQGNTNKMKAELEKITVDSEKLFVIEVASGIKDDLTNAKTEFLAKWMDVDTSSLFD